MTHYNYLIIGGGMTAAAAASGIRAHDKSGSIGIVAAEQETPYDRPPLSKGLWTGDKELSSVYNDLPEGVDLHTGRLAVRIDRVKKEVVDDQDTRHTYDKLLLATGSKRRRLPFGGDNVIYFRTLRDYERLRQQSENRNRFAVIGGGFIGSEIAAALAMQDKQVTLIFPDEGIGSSLYPADLSRFLNGYYREKGVEVLAGFSVEDINGSDDDLTVSLDDGRTLAVEGVVAGIGVTPNTSLAEEAGLEVDNGVRVNAKLQTSDPDIYAAGDVANYPDAVLGVHRRVEHEDAANSMGKTAGHIMAGAEERYEYSPFYYSDMFDLGYEAVGDLDSRLETVSDWQDPFRKGVVYYLDEGQVRGVLLWNVWGKVDDARDLIRSGERFEAEQLKGKIG